MTSAFGRIILEYIRFWAKVRLLFVRPDIIGITGSVGKTSTRDAVYLVLKSKYTCKKTVKANSESGIPLDILGLEMHSYSLLEWFKVVLAAPVKALLNNEKYEKYIVEMGIDYPTPPKNMSYLLRIIRPRTGVFVKVSAVHSQNFEHLVSESDPAKKISLIVKQIALEKGKLISSLPVNGYAILNIDDANIAEFVDKTDAKVITVGSTSADISYSNVSITREGFSCDFTYNSTTRSLFVRQEVLGNQYAVNFALAIATGIAHGVEFAACIDALTAYTTEPGRLRLLDGINNSTILDSSYNSSAEACLNALTVLDQIGMQCRRIAVLGDMRELGNEAQFEHERVIAKATQVCNEIYLIGPLMHKFGYQHAINLGFDKTRLHLVENALKCAEILKQVLRNGDIILVKGSQNTLFLEAAVEQILADPSDADKYLCRRGEYWDNMRAKTFNKNR